MEITYSKLFNTPVKFGDNQWFVNERIIEEVFVHSHVPLDAAGKRLLEFGCTRSNLALQLASAGYEVVGVDLRQYPFAHPHFTFYQQNITDFDDEDGFDIITSISTIEHVGLGAYGEDRDTSELEKTATKLQSLLKPGGKLIATVPFGRPYEDEFLRSLNYVDVLQLFPDLDLAEQRFYGRMDFKYWRPIELRQARSISNAPDHRGPTGVNCVGCFAWTKPAK
jgi:hypothetical protein